MAVPVSSSELRQLLETYPDDVQKLVADARQRLLAGSGKVHRYVTIAEPADLKRSALTQLLKSAFAAWQERRSGA